ncbi:hypothetical protein I314_06736, partial [Cryptococcus bacillisporus CA1873]
RRGTSYVGPVGIDKRDLFPNTIERVICLVCLGAMNYDIPSSLSPFHLSTLYTFRSLKTRMGIGSNWGKASNMLHFSSNLEHLETLASGNKGKQTSVPL